MSTHATTADVLAGRAPWAMVPGDCVAGMRALPDGCVHCAVTSPPYYGLRAYLEDDDPDKALEIGTEERPEEYVERMVCVFREVRRVLHPSGSLYLNLGDTYANDAKGPNGEPGPLLEGAANRPAVAKSWRNGELKKKDLIGIPWMVAFALRADGWYLRQWCPWVKRNPMPESAEDRPGTSCETVFLLAKRGDYFFDMEAVKRAAVAGANGSSFTDVRDRITKPNLGTGPRKEDDGTRNFRSSDLWFDSVGMLLADDTDDLLGFDVTLKPYKGAHFAVMPKKLIEPCVLAGTSAKGVCPACGEPWVRVVEKERKAARPGKDTKVAAKMGGDVAIAEANGWNRANAIGNRDPERHCTTTKTLGWKAGCDCDAGEPVPAIVLDPFAGSGTTLAVAVDHGRRAIGCELNRDYLPLVTARMRNVCPPLFGSTEATR